MHNILIVDDEDRDIKMLAMLLEHNFSEEYQVFFATSALEAFSEIKEYSPTLMFVDIKMPRMNGIELLNLIRGNKSIKNIYPVVVSAYNEFDYAKGAMLANAKDYLLKPVRANDIRATLEKYFAWYYRMIQQKKKRESLTKQINNLSYMLEKDIISAVIYNQEYLEQVSDYLNMSSIAYNWGTCFVLSVGQTQEMIEYAKLAGVRSSITQLVAKNQIQSISAFLQENIVFFLFSRSDHKQQFLQRINDVILQINNTIFTKLDLSPRLEVGEPFASNEGMQYSYRVCMSKLLNGSVPAQLKLTSPTDAQHIVQNIRTHKYHEANALMNQKIDTMLDTSPEQMPEQSSVLLSEIENMLFGKTNRSKEDYLAIILQGDNRRRTVFELLCEIEDAYSRLRENRQQKLVSQMRQFIDEKYNKQLSLTGLSQKFNLNSYYISKLFKEYTNQTFVEYLTWVRVTKAVQLIAEKRYSFKEIANMVGYNDPSYFSKVFKKITGKSPREYCDEALN